MSTRNQIEEALQIMLEPGERVEAFRPVVANGKVEDRAYETTLALLGPSVFSTAPQGSMTGAGEMPHRTNLIVITDRRVLWCHKHRIGNEIVVGGSDALGAMHSVDIVPARIALAKLRFTFADWSVVQFDLPSDHRAADFANDIMKLLLRVPAAV
ncbi:MAG: hypothetical protein ACI9C1_002019 [Candidatus Aldehydirespiratoraceae bacterium]|jgi:hypothetical protein